MYRPQYAPITLASLGASGEEEVLCVKSGVDVVRACHDLRDKHDNRSYPPDGTPWYDAPTSRWHAVVEEHAT